MSDLRNLFPCHKANRNAATPFCNTGKINPICHRTTPQKVNHANSRCSAHTDAIFTKLVSMKHKYDNENDHSNDCRDHPRPSAKTGRKADDIAVCFIPPQNTHPHGIRLPIMSCQHYTRRCAACQTRRCSICGHTGNMQKSTLSGAFLRVRSGSRAELCEHGLADLVHVADDAVGAVVEDRRLGVGVHGDDHVRVRKARDVVDRARHTERQQ